MKLFTKHVLVLFFFTTLLFAEKAAARIIYVDAATGDNVNNFAFDYGLSWGKPFKDLMHAIYWSAEGDEIWLSEGTYYPCQAINGLGTANADRSLSFYPKKNTRIYGGFSKSRGGLTMATRNPNSFITILSGDVQRDGNTTNNAYTIIKTYLGSGFSVLDGVTVTGAYPNTGALFSSIYGGGMYLNFVSPTISNCKFDANRATQGGAVYCDKSNPTFYNCSFTNNSVIMGQTFILRIASRGGAIYNAGSSPAFYDCTFANNSAIYNSELDGTGVGGAVCNESKFGGSSPYFGLCTFTGNNSDRPTGSSVVFDNGGSANYNTCTFSNNSCKASYSIGGATNTFVACDFVSNIGGGMRIEESGTQVYNCVFRLNNNAKWASGKNDGLGGGVSLYNTKVPFPVISNCLMYGNTAERGGGIDNHRSTANINNCTITSNTSAGVGGGVYTEGRGWGGLAPGEIYYDRSTFYQNCIVFGNFASTPDPRDSIKVNFFTGPTSFGHYLPPLIFWTTEEYTYRPTITNCMIGKLPKDSLNKTVANDGGGNILNVNPKFTNAFASVFTVEPCSRAIDGGNNSFIPGSSPTASLDLNNQPRIFGGNTVDIGCYEKQANPGAYLSVSTVGICEGGSTVIFGQTQTVAGSYFRTLVASNGCDSVLRVDLVIRPKPTANSIQSNNCFSTGTLELKPTLGTAPFSITLNSVTRNNIQADSSASFPNLNGGSYNYTITDSYGCVGTGTTVLTTNILNSSIVYVDSLAQGNNSGRNFANAVTSLQKALDLASCTGVTQIWVAKGTYFPSKNIGGQTTNTNNATFRMLNGVTIYGGFNQRTGDTTLARRNWKLHTTTLSGDVQQDGEISNNVYNVINNYDNGLNNTAVIDGFTITGAFNTYDFAGGVTYGGGMTNNGSSPTVKNCTFYNNRVVAGTQAFGAGIFNLNCSPIISNCKFIGNIVSGSYFALGAGIYNDLSAPTISSCEFVGNQTLNATLAYGAAIANANGASITISNCLFAANNGGAIASYNNNLVLKNSTIYSNTAPVGIGGGLYNYGGGTPTISNCIIVGNSNGNITNPSGTVTINHSNIGTSGGSSSWNTAMGVNAGGNIDADPQFTADLRLSPCSPSKDAGSNVGVAGLDLDNNPRIVGTTVDMGCYEYQTNFSAYGSIVYVNANATGLNNGTSWANAFTDLSDALKLAACAGINSIYVSKGTYYTSLNANYGLPSDYQAPTFALRNGVNIVGGFSVADGATTLANRNYVLYKTILSGDANKDGVLENNCKAVVTATAGVTGSTVLDGFTIQDAYNNTTGNGAGMFILSASPTITNCTFISNAISFATGQGAGVYVNGGNPVFNNCKFYSNTISATTAAFGGGVYNVSAGSVFNDCEFKGNLITSSSNAFGAGIYNFSCGTITVNRCKFETNTASAANVAGAGIYATISSPMLVDNCLFNNNIGGALCTDNSGLGLTNSTIINNTTNQLEFSGGYLCINSTPTITNCIFYNNSNRSIVNYASTPVIKNSLIQGSGGSTAWVSNFGTDAGGNKDQSPLLTADFGLTVCSPAVDAGHNAISSSLDLNKNTRIRNATVDMGCYESNFNTSIYGSRVYVDSAATGNNDGTSWANAFKDLQTALGLAKCLPIAEIYVSKGTYFPSASLVGEITNNQFSCFSMKNNLSILGGFSVANGITTLATRNPTLYSTILSAEIQKDAEPLNNAYNVINNYDTNLDTTAVLDGFTITGVYNTYNWSDGVTNAGAIINFNSSPKIVNCIITDNTIAAIAEGYGAGIYNKNASPVIRNCSFIRNNITAATHAYGGAIYNSNSNPIITGCKFDNNTVTASNIFGSAIYNNGGSPVNINNSLFTNNNGSAISLDANNAIISNVTITTLNTAVALYNVASSATISNSIFYGTSGTPILTSTPSLLIRNSLIQGSGGSAAWNATYGTDGGNNKDVNPLFTSDYHLTTCSPAINAGNNTFVVGTVDLDNLPRIRSSSVDMGCYESPYSNTAYGSTLYVNASATGNNDGTSWANAFTNLQDALTLVSTACSATITSIYVSKGTYHPSAAANGLIVNNQFSCFQMKNNLSIIGGFSVADGVTTLAAKNPTLYPATLSGDIQKDGIDGNNVYNVINNYSTGIDTTAVLDGFYITGAWNNITGIGGGIINAYTSPKFVNCTIWGNFAGGTATARGAGMHNLSGSPIIRKCTFITNTASGISSAFGAGLSNDNSTPKIEQCIFKDNVVNAPNPAGGGMYSNGAGGSISNSLFTGNTGTAICADASIYTLYNTTIANNSGTPALSRAGGLLLINSNFNILNSVVYSNTNGSITNSSSTPTFYFCTVEGSGAPASWESSYGINGGGNTSSNPLFTSEYRLQACSPLINAGDAASAYGSLDLDNTARVKNGVIDVGCYETTEARPTILSAPEPASTFGTSSVTLNATTNGSNSINWYATATGGSLLFTGTSFVTPSITTPTYYYAEASNGSCATMPRVAVRATVFPIYYSTGNNDAATLSNWNTESNASGNSATSFTDTARFVIQTGHTVSLGGSSNLNIANNLLTIQPNASIAHNSTGNIQLAGNLVNNGSITGNGILLFNGSSTQTVSGTGTISNLTINNAAGVSLTAAQKITGTLTPTLGTLTTNGNLTLASNATGTARIAAVTGAIVGNVTVERYIPAGKRSFRFLTSPVTTTNFIKGNWQEGATSSTANPTPGYGTHITGSIVDQTNGFDATSTGNASMFQFNNASQLWNSGIANTNATNLLAGNAYRLMIRGDRTIDLNTQPSTNTATTLRATGTLITGAVTFGNVSSSPLGLPTLATNASEFSFIGNPYASPIDWNAITKTGLTGYYYIWDPTLATRGAYVSCFTDGTKSNNSSAISTAIQSGQAFFVQNTSATASRQLQITEANKTTGNTNVFRTQASTSTLAIQLYLTSNINSTSQDGATALFNNTYSDSVNDDDANKFTNLDENIAIQRGTSLMSIERRNTPTLTDTVQLKTWQLAQNNYTLKIDATNFEGTTNAYLQDNYLNNETPLNLNGITNVNFTTNAVAASRANNRFTIVFRSNTPLPVAVTNLKAYQKNTGVQVEWETQNELNLQQYEVEKSTDATNFTKVGTVQATAATSYNWFDVNANKGNNFYRLKMIEKDGSFKYSTIVNVKIGSIKNVFTVVGNPIKNKSILLQLENVEKGNYTLNVFNNLGQSIASKTINHAGGSATETIVLGNVATGTYQLSIVGNHIQEIKSIIIQ